MPDSPLAELTVGRCRAGGRQARRASRMRQRAVPVADVMRHGKVERIEKRADHVADSRSTSTRERAFGHVRRSEGGRAARRDPRDARGQRGGGRAHPQPEDRRQPDHRRRGLGHRHGAARGDGDRPPLRPHHERQHRRVSCAGACRRARHQGDLRRRARTTVNPLGIKGVGRDRHRGRRGARSRTRSTTRPACACATCRSRWTRYWARQTVRRTSRTTTPTGNYNRRASR